ncbi:MAG: CoA transferase, partial [Burkholderiales bacterium]
MNKAVLPPPLAGKRVVDLSQFIASPSAAQYLADFGADVTKIESTTGDGSRTLPGNAFGSYYVRSFNTNKASCVLNLREAADRAALDVLLATVSAVSASLARRRSACSSAGWSSSIRIRSQARMARRPAPPQRGVLLKPSQAHIDESHDCTTRVRPSGHRQRMQHSTTCGRS